MATVPGVRKLLLPGLLAVTGLLAGCGGGDDDNATPDDGDTASTSTTATSVVGTDGSGTTVTIGEGGSVDPTGTTLPLLPEATTPIDPATIDTLPPAPGGGEVDPGFPPAEPGNYAYNTTGTVGGQPVNGPTVTSVTALGPNEIRYAATDQILDLQYRPDGIYLRQLTAKIASFTISFQSAEGVLFIPNPTDAGQSWDWQLTDTSGQLTAIWHGTTQAPEAVVGGSDALPRVDAVISIGGSYDTGTLLGTQQVAGTVNIRLWIDPAMRLPVQLHQVTQITRPAIPGLGADTTSTYTGRV